MTGRHRFRARLATLVAASILVFQAVSPELPIVRGVDPNGSPAPAASTSPDPSTIGTSSGASGPTVAAATTAATIVAYRATGYRYSVVAHGAGTGFELVGFDDSPWAMGTAAFGSGGACALEATVATTWTPNTDILVRRHVALPAGTTGVTVGIAIDNDVTVYWNGVLIGSGSHDFCPSLDSFVFSVPDGQLTSDNVLAVRGVDRGDQTFLDIAVRGSLPVGADRFLGQGANPHQNDPTGTQAEPVNTYSGNYTNVVADLSLPGRRLPFAFIRTYNSVRSGADGPLGPGWSHPYGASLVLNADGTVTFVSEDGSAIPYRPDGLGGFTGAAGVLSTLAPVAAGGYTITRRDGLRYVFDAVGRLISETDRNGNSLAFAYSGSDLAAITDSVGRTVSLTVDAAHHITGLSDPIGRTVTYGHDVAGRLVSVTDVRGGVTAYTYDAGGRLATITDPNGHVLVTNTYDASARVVEQVDARGNHTTFAYDAATGTTTMTDARGGAWVDTYQGPALVARRDPLGDTTRYAYDAAFNRTSVTDPRGNATTMTYDARGNLLTRIAPAPLGYQETFTYSATNDLLTAMDRRGATTTNTYDGAGNPTKRTAPDGTFTTFTYDPHGLLLTATDARGKTTTFAYDAQANRNRVATPLGEVTTMTYDAAGRPVTMVEPRGNATGALPAAYTTTFTYDAASHVLTVTDPLGHVTTTTYDPAGNRTSASDPNGHTTTYAYNPSNELASVTDARGKTTTYTYDQVANLTTRTDPNNHLTTYTYDAADRLVSEARPLNRVWTYAYDAAGNRTQIVDAIGNATPTAGDGTRTFAYDQINRLASISYSDGSPSDQFAYDPNSNRIQMVQGGWVTTYAYDALNRPTQAGSPFTPNIVMSYTYDAAGNVLTRTPSNSTAVTYTHDDDGRIATMTFAGQTTTYTYDPAGNLTSTSLPSGNGYVETRTYDDAGRLTEVKNAKGATSLSKSTYTLDPAGNRTAIVTTTGTTTLIYDPLDRLTTACYTTACTGPGDNFRTYVYDDVGNRLSEGTVAGTTTYTYDPADELTASSGPAGNVSYTYDADGNQTVAGSQTFTYDLADRLKTRSSGNTTYTYGYDGDGRRISTATGPQASKTTKFLWDINRPLASLVEETDGNGGLTREYHYGTGLVSMQVGTSAYYFHRDGLGSVVNLTSASGATQWTYDYHPYGVARTTTKNSNQAPANLVRFTGQYLDPTGLYHLRARQYDPTTGRFLTVDPQPDTMADPYLSTYAYANSNPVRFVDPSGRESKLPSAETNPAGCLTGLLGADLLSGASLVVGLGGLALQGGSVTLFGASVGTSAPVSAGGIAAGFLLEGIAVTGEVTAIALVNATCIAPEHRQ